MAKKKFIFLLGILIGTVVFLSPAAGPVRTAYAGEYAVADGDTLWDIAVRCGTSVEVIRQANHLDSEFLSIGQILFIPNSSADPVSRSSSRPVVDRNGLQQYSVAAGDTLWDIATNCGTNVNALLQVNNLDSEMLQIGQVLVIPSGNKIPDQVSRGVSRPAAPLIQSKSGYGELISWNDADVIFPTGGIATLQDFETGRQFKIYRMYGGNHADCEPLTAYDTKVMKEIYGGQWSWDRRAVLLLINGRAIAASMNGMPHGDQTILDNNFPGQFCLHFLNSSTHGSNTVDPDHQAAVHQAAGC